MKEIIYKLSKQGQILHNPKDILKEPYVFEFLDIPENKKILESDLERRLIKHMENFLLELGKGFMFVGSQQRISIVNNHYYVDMVFYNKILKCYVLIDLKIGTMKPEYAGQMNMYLNNYNKIEDNIWIHKTANIDDRCKIIGPCIIGKNTNIYPLSMVRKELKENVILKNDGTIINKEL